MKELPQRTCLACRKTLPKEELLRFVANNGQIYFDISGKAEGRGAYTCPSQKCMAKAKKSKALARAFNGATLSDDFLEQITSLLHSKILQNLGLAKKSDLLIIGSDSITEGKEPLSFILLAKETAENTRQKIESAVKRRFGASFCDEKDVETQAYNTYVRPAKADETQKIDQKCALEEVRIDNLRVLIYTVFTKEDFEQALGIPNCTCVGIKPNGSKMLKPLLTKYTKLLAGE